MSGPTARQTQVYELWEKLGNQGAAARELGITQGAVVSAIRGYRRNAGIDEPLPPTTPIRRRTLTQREQLEAIGPELARLAEQGSAVPLAIETLSERIDGLERQILQWTARQPVFVVPSHRRQADGGVGGREEARRLPRDRS